MDEDESASVIFGDDGRKREAEAEADEQNIDTGVSVTKEKRLVNSLLKKVVLVCFLIYTFIYIYTYIYINAMK